MKRVWRHFKHSCAVLRCVVLWVRMRLQLKRVTVESAELYHEVCLPHLPLQSLAETQLPPNSESLSFSSFLIIISEALYF